MTPKQLKAMKLALEALKLLTDTEQTFGALDYGDNAITALEEALAQPEQEPVAWPCHIIEADFSERTITLGMECGDYKVSAGPHWLSTHPPQRTWVGLTTVDRKEIERQSVYVEGAIRMTEAKLKEKNSV